MCSKRTLKTLSLLCIYALAIINGHQKICAQIAYGQLSGQTSISGPAVPFLTFAPDGRSAALGCTGVALFSPDANSVHWNMSNLVNADRSIGMAFNYAPWVRNLVPRVKLLYLSGYAQLTKNSVIGGAIRYFSLGNIYFTNFLGGVPENFTPKEFSIEGGYGLRFNPKFSLGINFRFIYSDVIGRLILNGIATKSAYSGAGDINMTYQNKFAINGKSSAIKLGLNIQNLGSKMTYTTREVRNFIPTNLKIGAGWKLNITEHKEIGLYADANKLLVPIPPPAYQMSVLTAISQSFIDPGAGLKSCFFGIGSEYGYTNKYDVKYHFRLGLFREYASRGGGEYFTFGLGGRWKAVSTSIALIVPKLHKYINQWHFTLGVVMSTKK